MKFSKSKRMISGLALVVSLMCAFGIAQSNKQQESKSTITVLPPTPNTPPPQQQQPQPAQPAQPAQPGAPAAQPGAPAAQPGQAGQPAQPGQAAQPGQPAAAGQPAQPAASGLPANCPPQSTQKKEIKDQAEYNTYVNALGQANPGTKAQSLEQFLLQYPNTVVKDDALEALMGAYQQAGDANKMQDAANRLLQVNPNAVRALALMAYTSRAKAEQGGADVQNASQQSRQYGEKGLAALECFAKPAGMSDADFATQKKQMAAIFNGAAARGALNMKDYPAAQKFFSEAVALDPNSLGDVYAAAVSYLELKPINPLGLWYAARATALSANNPASNAQIDKYGHAKYQRYHGADPTDDHWKELVAQAATQNAPPAGFTVPPAPTPAQQAAKLAQTKDPKTMDFADLETVFGNAEPAVSQQVLTAIKGQPMQPFAAKVIQATPTQLSVAATQDAIEQNRADVIVNMVAPLPAKLLPKPGSDTGLTGSVDSFTVGQAPLNPNDPTAMKPVVITLTEGKLVRTAPEPAPKKPVRRTPTRRR
jgi:tetratricopeptide (TPR) repeat protein